MKHIFAFLFALSTAFSIADADAVAFDFEGRVRPLESLGRIAAFDLCGKKSCGGADGEELVRKIRAGIADTVPLFKIRSGDVVQILHLPEDRRFFARGEFENFRGLIAQYAERTDSRPQTLEFVRLDAAIALFDSLKSESFWSRISVPSVSESERFRLRAECVYLQFDFSFWVWVLSLVSFSLVLASFLFSRFPLLRIGGFFSASVAFFSFALLVFRGIVEAQVPLLSLYEILFALVVGVSFAGTISSVRFRNGPLSVCASGVVLLLLLFLRASFETGDLFLPVSVLLDSPFWLSLHVFSIASGFCVLLLSSVIAHLSLFLRVFGKPVPARNSALLSATLSAGLVLSSAGIILGGFWADVAWGRFWGFDPKENAALMVVLWAALVLHLRAARLAGEKAVEVLAALLSLFIAFCLLGINLLGVGLHSYGFSDGIFWGFSGSVVIDGVAIAFLALKKGPLTKKR